jgi:hypothetical protein
MAKGRKGSRLASSSVSAYSGLMTGIADLLDRARRAAARSVNSVLTTTYWEIGRRIVEYEQGGKTRAEYGQALLKRLSSDLVLRHGRGFSERNLEQMRAFYLGWEISQTASAKFEARVLRSVASYRIDLLLFHRRLRCLVVIDLKIGSFTRPTRGR